MSDLEEKFNREVKWLKLPAPQREYRFHKKMQWLFDFAWPEQKVAVEIEGGTRYFKSKTGKLILGAHSRHKGYHKDCNKYNEAAKEGWKVFRFTSEHVKKGEASKFIEDYFKNE